ncbi:hypothetical protein D3C78_499860 [compost metagenome]
MKNIVKGAEPEELARYAANKPGNTWEQFTGRSPRRIAVQQQLLSDQGGLCAYCEIDLKAADEHALADLRVEHFHPKSDCSTAHNWHLDWQNLLAVCHGGSQRKVVDAAQRFTSPEYSCDVPKADNNWDALICNPLQLPARPGLFRFERSSGAMHIDREACLAIGVDVERAQATIDRLQLDGKRLRNLRKPVLERLNDQLYVLTAAGMPLPDARQRLARLLLRRDAEGRWPVFFSAIRSYLGEAAEQQLRAIGYRG